MDSCELECWENCHGTPLTLGLKVKTTDDYDHAHFRGGEFHITSIRFDSKGVNIGININGNSDDFKTQYDGFRINELTLAN